MRDDNDLVGRFGYVPDPRTAAFTNREWAWEFLRANLEFAADWHDVAEGFAVARVSESRCAIVERDARPDLTRWGVRYTSAPDLDALATTVFWAPELSVSVLRMYALCQCKHLDTPPLFRFGDLPCATTLLLAADGVQHLLFQEDGHTLQVRIAGASVDEPVYLFAEAMLHPDHAPVHLRALRCFDDLRRTGHLLEKYFPPEPHGARLAEVLHTFELSRAHSLTHDIAVGLYGQARVDVDWPDSRSGMFDHVRKTLKRAESLVQGGYRNLLV